MPATRRKLKSRHLLVQSKGRKVIKRKKARRVKFMLSRGKWTKHRFMMRSPELRSTLPHTQLMNRQSFLSFMKRYRSIIVKPSNGSGGTGVMQVTTLGINRYEIRYGRRRNVVKGIQASYLFVRRMARGTYVVQQKISLAKIKGRPFDVRVMVQKTKQGRWVVTGTLAKIAGSGHFITNIVRSGGRALPLSTAIRHSNVRGVPNQIIRHRINQIAVSAVRRLHKHYPLRIVGLDIGIDTRGKVWIIEANFSPDKTYFLRLKDKKMYRRIMAYYRQKR